MFLLRLSLALTLAGCGEAADVKAPEDTATVDSTTTPTDGDRDGDGHTATSAGDDDCDDADADVHPGATETCDGIDQDCDGTVDDDATDATDWHPDADGDGYGDTSVIHVSCVAPDGDIEDDQDCDDTDPTVHPEGIEICDDGIDQDCDGASTECLWTGEVDLAGADAIVVEPGGESSTPAVHGGDVSGDGVPDLLLGEPYGSAYQHKAGAVHVLFGAVAGEVEVASAGATLLGEAEGDLVGNDVHAADLNGDGQLDVVVGASYSGVEGNHTGAAYVVYGPVAGEIALADSDAKAVGAPEDFAGWSVGSGDVTGDGSADLLVGAIYAREVGVVYVVAGPVAGAVDLEAADTVLEGDRNDGSGSAGWCTATADLDGDGMDDILTGAPGTYDGGTTYLTLGPVSGVTPLASADARLQGEKGGNYSGHAVVVGEFDGDGTPDVAVGAPYNAGGGRLTGAAYVVLGPLAGDLALQRADAKITGANEYEEAGVQLAASDLDGDSVDELVVGSWLADLEVQSTGAVSVVTAPFAGTTSLADARARFTTDGTAGGPSSAVFAGELDGSDEALDGSGLGDLLLGGRDGVAAYVLYGVGD